ncbi:MAG: DNA cytosine methyltransferase [Bacteroidota bacterium]
MPEISPLKIIQENPNETPVLTTELKAVDFFCGAGGVTCGFTEAGIKVLGGIDIDIACKDTYEKNNPGTVFLNKDISKYKPKDLAKDLNINRKDDNLIFVGCSPCQYYSGVNTKKEKSATTRLLLVDFQRFVNFFRPGFIFIENVPGLEKKAGSPLSKFKTFLTKKGYSFSDKVVNAKYLGVPQNRRRYILIASRLINKVELPPENRVNIKTVYNAIGDLKKFPPISAGHKDPTTFIHSAASITPKNIERLTKTPADGGSRSEWANTDLQLECYKRHSGHGDVYGRMHWKRPSPTITTKFVSVSNGRYGHPEQLRAISLREGAVLQSFKPDYIFYNKGQGNIARMIGNAVPPKMAKEIGNTIIKNKQNASIQSQSTSN